MFAGRNIAETDLNLSDNFGKQIYEKWLLPNASYFTVGKNNFTLGNFYTKALNSCQIL